MATFLHFHLCAIEPSADAGSSIVSFEALNAATLIIHFSRAGLFFPVVGRTAYLVRENVLSAQTSKKCVFPTWEQPSCEEVEDGEGAGSQGNKTGPVDALSVLDHVHVDAAQPLAQSVGLHDCQVLSLLAPPVPLERLLIQPQVLTDKLPGYPHSLTRAVVSSLCNASGTVMTIPVCTL